LDAIAISLPLSDEVNVHAPHRWAKTFIASTTAGRKYRTSFRGVNRQSENGSEGRWQERHGGPKGLWVQPHSEDIYKTINMLCRTCFNPYLNLDHPACLKRRWSILSNVSSFLMDGVTLDRGEISNRPGNCHGDERGATKTVRFIQPTTRNHPGRRPAITPSSRLMPDFEVLYRWDRRNQIFHPNNRKPHLIQQVAEFGLLGVEVGECSPNLMVFRGITSRHCKHILSIRF